MPKVIPEYREEAKKKIISAGYDVMSKKGYCDTTLDDIASHVGVSKTTLYLYFKNKEDLVMEIIRSVHEEIHVKSVTLFHEYPILEAYSRLLEIFLDRDIDRIGFTYDIFALSSKNARIREIHQQYMESVMENVTQGIICLQNKGVIRQNADPKTLALGMIALLNGLSAMLLKGMNKDEIRDRFYQLGVIILEINPDMPPLTPPLVRNPID